jgi:hypothetical protein
VIPLARFLDRPFRLLPGLAALLIAAAGCAGPQMADRNTRLGPPTRVGQGTARAFVTLDPAGAPAAIGVVLTEAALKGLPPEPPPGEDGWEYVLRLPREAKAAGYDHVGLDWNPHGHIPPGVYTVPHFDVHFYRIDGIDEAARARITAKGADLERAHKQPAPDLMPAGYVLPPGTEVPRMGAHAIDPAGGEFHGQGFTKTFIYGFYDGQLVFIEPMVAKAFLEAHPDVTDPVAVPRRYAAPGYYPTRYSVRYDAARKTYSVTLEDLCRQP